MITTTFFPSWPYDEALTWMNKQHALLERDPSLVMLGIGSHQEAVITLGKNLANGIIHYELLKNYPEVLVRKIERGGGATLHEPGQIVVYPVLNLAFHGLHVKDLVALLEHTIKDFLVQFGLDSYTGEYSPGMFINGQKIGFIGLRIKEGVSSHGLALNVLNEGSLYKLMDPCGIANLSITSLCRHRELTQGIDYFLPIMRDSFIENFSIVTSRSAKKQTKIHAAL